MKKLTREFIYLERDLLCMLGRYENFFRNADGHRIIIYHGVCEKDAGKYNTLFVTRKTFESHLQFYQKYFHVISLDDFYQKKFLPGRFNISLSFDDGFANNYTYVLPLLEKYGMPATFFITAIRKEQHNILWNDFLTISSVSGPAKLLFSNTVFSKQKGSTYVSELTGETLAETLRHTGFEEKKQIMQLLAAYASFKETDDTHAYWLQMTETEIKAASASPLITIGSHGFYHNDLGKIPVEEIRRELLASKSFLEGLIQKRITQIAFPYGSYTGETVSEAVKAGYEQLYATHFFYTQDKNNPFMRERMGINPFLSTHNQMYAIIKGSYE